MEPATSGGGVGWGNVDHHVMHVTARSDSAGYGEMKLPDKDVLALWHMI